MLITTTEGTSTGIQFPVLEVVVSLSKNGYEAFAVLPSCCFHDLIGAPDEELAGMGLAIIGNLCKSLEREQLFDRDTSAELHLRMSPKAEPIKCPWPGMPDDRPAPLDLTQMPFESAMFLGGDDQQLKRRVDRLQLMNRIQSVWVPWLRSKLVSYA